MARWQSFGGQFSLRTIASGQLSLGESVQGTIVWGVNFPWGQLSLGAVVWEATIRGAIIQGAIVWEGVMTGEFSSGAIVLEPGFYWGAILHNVFLEGAILRMSFLREHF